jgi:hypothetical protein
MKVYNLLWQSTLTLTLGWGWTNLSSLPAQAFGLRDTNQARLEFFDQAGGLVGNGSVTYRPFDGRFVQIQGYGEYESPSNPYQTPENGGPWIERQYTPPADYLQVSNLTVDLSSVGLSFTKSHPLTQTGQNIVGSFVPFWNPPSTDTFTGGEADTLYGFGGGDGRYRNSGFFATNDWTGCVPQCGTFQRQIYSISSNGTWSFFGPSSTSSASRSNTVGGTWRAIAAPTAAPEPTTITGSIVAALVTWKLKQQSGKKAAG